MRQQQQQPGEGRSDRASKDVCMVIMSSAALCMAYGVIQSGKLTRVGTVQIPSIQLCFSFPLSCRGEMNRFVIPVLVVSRVLLSSSVQEFRDIDRVFLNGLIS